MYSLNDQSGSIGSCRSHTVKYTLDQTHMGPIEKKCWTKKFESVVLITSNKSISTSESSILSQGCLASGQQQPGEQDPFSVFFAHSNKIITSQESSKQEEKKKLNLLNKRKCSSVALKGSCET